MELKGGEKKMPTFSAVDPNYKKRKPKLNKYIQRNRLNYSPYHPRPKPDLFKDSWHRSYIPKRLR